MRKRSSTIIPIVLKNSDVTPLYLQIAGQLRKAIIHGDALPGESLPSIRTLAADLSISVITTKRAYDILEEEGLIETIPGKGCFVADQGNQILRERRLRLLENLLREALKQARYLGLSRRELVGMLTLLDKEKDNE